MSLPERQRDAIVMRELEGRSYEEIAARLGASHGAVRQLLNRARHAIRDRVGAITGFEPLLRSALQNANGATAARLGALSGRMRADAQGLLGRAAAGGHPRCRVGLGPQ